MEELNVPTLLLKFVRSVLRWSSIMILVGIIMMVYSGLNAQTDGFVYNINSGVAVEFSSKYIKQDQDLQFSVDLMSYNGEAINYDTEKILSLVVQKSETSTFEKYDIVITMTGNNMDLYKSVGEGYYRLVITNSGDKDA
ncbi:MAG: hypothetical protein OEZ01_14465, partial [Candidatus Heimdallarchaeota archaeon]|nr:hypothetical protein [Candidatus Heimdallarchaeota archaeon]